MINQSLLNIGLYIQPLETCLAFSCPLTLFLSISCQATSRPANLPKFVFHFHVRQFHAWTLRPSNLCPPISCTDIWSVYFILVNFISRHLVRQFHVCQIHACHFVGPPFSCPSFLAPPALYWSTSTHSAKICANLTTWATRQMGKI